MREATLRPLKGGPQRMVAVAGLAIWAAIVLAPLVILYASVVWSPVPANLPAPDVSVTEAAAWTAALARAWRSWPPSWVTSPAKPGHRGSRPDGPLLADAGGAGPAAPCPLLHLVHAAESDGVAGRPGHAADSGGAGGVHRSVVVGAGLGYWPLAALLLAQGWRNVDPDCLKVARLETSGWQRLVTSSCPCWSGPCW